MGWSGVVGWAGGRGFWRSELTCRQSLYDAVFLDHIDGIQYRAFECMRHVRVFTNASSITFLMQSCCGQRLYYPFYVALVLHIAWMI